MQRLIVDGSDIGLEAITFFEKGFGRCINEGSASYALTVDAEVFARRMGSLYADCIAELVSDDELTGQFHPPYSGATSYPSLDELFEIAEAQRKEMVDAYFVFDILRAYVQEEAAGPSVKWMIKSLDSLSRQGGAIFIEGRAVPT